MCVGLRVVRERRRISRPPVSPSTGRRLEGALTLVLGHTEPAGKRDDPEPWPARTTPRSLAGRLSTWYEATPSGDAGLAPSPPAGALPKPLNKHKGAHARRTNA